MAQIITFNNVAYTVPSTGDTAWGTNVSNYLVAIAAGALQLSGGAFPLTADATFGSSFGLQAQYYKSNTANIAATGVLRLASADAIAFRNAANGADISISKDGSDNLQYNATKVLLSGAVVNADIASGAAIGLTKLAALAFSANVVTDGSGVLTTANTAAWKGTANQVLGTNNGATAQEWKTIAGTPSQITITHTTNTVTASLPSAIGVNTADATQISNHSLVVAKTVSSPGDHTANAQLSLLDVATPTKQLALGYDIGNSYGFLQAANQGTSFQPITINPDGGAVNVRGSSTNDSAAAGFVGEYVSSSIGATNFPATGNYGDLTSISLTAGDWDVSLFVQSQANGATVSAVTVGTSTTTGNSSAGFTGFTDVTPPTSTANKGDSVPNVRFSLSATTTVYLKYRANYSVATPQATGTIVARRRR